MCWAALREAAAAARACAARAAAASCAALDALAWDTSGQSFEREESVLRTLLLSRE